MLSEENQSSGKFSLSYMNAYIYWFYYNKAVVRSLKNIVCTGSVDYSKTENDVQTKYSYLSCTKVLMFYVPF